MEKPQVGQIIYSLNVGNASRYTKQELTEHIVKKVGRKYFMLGKKDWPEHMDTQFFIDTWKENTEYSSNYKLYKSKQHYKDEKEAKALIENITGFFGIYGHRDLMPIDDLRKIKEIISKYTGRKP